MIKVIIKADEIEIKGHANYADYGKDIVCASVSAIVTTTINGILRINTDINYKEDIDRLVIKVNKKSDVTVSLLENMICLLKDLEIDYKKNISVIEMRDKK